MSDSTIIENPAPLGATDLSEFEHFLEKSDIPEDQREEFLALLWSIMVQFAALGFGADAASQAIAAHLLSDTDQQAGKPPCKLTAEFSATHRPDNNKNSEERIA